MDEYKRCPDCAEMVRAQARRCRFCGHRFPERRERAPLDFLRRPPPTATLEEVLEGWGTELAAGEEIEFFGFCHAERDDGYLLLTSRRLLFHRSRGAMLLLAWDRADLRGVQVARRWGGRELRIGGPDRVVAFGRFASAQMLERLAERLGRSPEG